MSIEWTWKNEALHILSVFNAIFFFSSFEVRRSLLQEEEDQGFLPGMTGRSPDNKKDCTPEKGTARVQKRAQGRLRTAGRALTSSQSPLVPLEKSCPLQIMDISTSNKFPYHGSVQKVGSWLPTNFHTMEVSIRLEVSWKFVGSRNDFHDLKRTRFSQCPLFKVRHLLFQNATDITNSDNFS